MRLITAGKLAEVKMLGIAFGTRPEFLKLKPVIKEFTGKIPFKIIFTGQHEHLIDDLDYDVVQLQITDGINRLDSLVSSLMNLDCLDDLDFIMIQGDTTSVLSLALAAFHRKIKVIHLEAGLRTYDFENPYPEEMNRQLVSRIADIHLCPTELDNKNLLNECVHGKIHVVGNTVLDNLVELVPSYNNEVLITMHRRENHQIIPLWFKEFEKLALENQNLQFILISHPNPNVQKHLNILKNVNVISPLPHECLLERLKECRFIITDSGGLQEESCFLKKKSIVCREKTERKAGVGTWSFLCKKPFELKLIFDMISSSYIPPQTWECPYGNGKSSQKIYNILKDML